MLTTTQMQMKERRTQWERRFQSIMLTLCSAGIVWGVQTLATVDKTQAVYNGRITNLEIIAASSYTTKEAKRDVSDILGRIDQAARKDADHDHRFEALDRDMESSTRRIRSLESVNRARGR